MSNRLPHWFPMLLTLVACAPADSQGHGHEHETEEPDGATAVAGRIEVPASVRRNLGLTFVPVEVRQVDATLRIPGRFELEPLARVEHRMSLPGEVELLVDQYQPVEPGTLLYRYRSPAWPELLHEIVEGEQAIDSAKAAIGVAEAANREAQALVEAVRDRRDRLVDAGFEDAEVVARLRELQASLPRLEAEEEAARTRLANAERQHEHAVHRASIASGIAEEELLRPVSTDGAEGGTHPAYHTIDWIEVAARSAGVVERIAVTNGAFVEPTELVVSVVDPSRVRFRAQALQADLPELVALETARLVPPPSHGMAAGSWLEAAVSLGLESHPEERTIELVATPREAADWARPGIARFLELVRETSGGPALAIPRSCVVRDGLEDVFFRRDAKDPDVVIRVVADLGVDDGRWVVLQSGVTRGDEVVLDGVYELKLATQKAGAVETGGHVHADGTVHGDH